MVYIFISGQMALKMADVSNVARPWSVSSRWSNRVCHEFFAQGDLERSLGLDIAPINDRTKSDVAQIQTGENFGNLYSPYLL